MGVDSDLIGVITASAVVGVCLCIVVVLTSCVCFRRLESKRRKDQKRRSNNNNNMVGWPIYPSHALPPLVADGDASMEQATRIGDYRPRILSPNSPRSSGTGFNTSSFPKIKGDVSFNGSPTHTHSPHHNHHQQPSPTPLYSNSLNANGHVMVPISLAAQHYRMVTASGTQDFYDARATTAPVMPIRPYQSHEEFIETEYYPDVVFDSSPKAQQQRTTPSNAPSEGTTKDLASNHWSNGDTQPQTAPDDVDSKDNEEFKRKDEKRKSTDNESRNSKESAVETNHVTSNANEDNVNQEVNGSSSQYKVIKKQHGHAKMPAWMVRDYEEAESSIEVEEEQPAPNDTPVEGTKEEENQEAGLVSVMVGDYSQSYGTPRDPPEDYAAIPTKPGVVTWSSTVEESTTSIIQDYSSTNYIKDFTILDYVDPPLPPPPPPTNLQEYDAEPTFPRDKLIDNVNKDNKNVNDNSKDVNTDEDDDKAIRERKAAVLRQIRQKVNESAERMPPAFTSTPRVDPEALPMDSLPPPPPPPPGSIEGGSRRQRHENEGSLDELPPVIGDTKL